MNRKLILLAALIGLAALSACNTIRGVGQDIKKAGQTIEGAAKN
jgi:predicted small secreted protein